MASTSGKFGYPVITNDDPMEGPEQITNAAAFWDGLIAQGVTDVAALPDPSTVPSYVSVWVVAEKCLYISTGSAWLRSTTADDTGWITPTLASGWTGFPSEAPQYRRMNGIVYLQGRGSSTGASTSAFVLPVGFRTNYNRLFVGNSGGTFLQGEVFANGGVGCTTTVAVTNFSFGACPSFPADA